MCLDNISRSLSLFVAAVQLAGVGSRYDMLARMF